MSKRESGIVGGIAALAIRAKTFVMEGGSRQDLPVTDKNVNGSKVKTSAGKRINSAAEPSGQKSNCEDLKNVKVEASEEEGRKILNKIDGKETRQAVSYKKTQKKTERKAALQNVESTAGERTKESQEEENNGSNTVQNKGVSLRFKDELLGENQNTSMRHIKGSSNQPIMKNQSTEDLESVDADERRPAEKQSSNALKRRSKMVQLKLDERSDMGKLADQIVPQLNSMQKNLLGLLFFNELSENIVEDLVTQQLEMMPSHQFAQTLATLDKEVILR